ncbi:hypothetical protein LJK88_46620 [Paenibacillus sp. P26]|nr:hypothetical protein LJK88_46620 [Paenibacillus sp. P26]
MMNAHNMIEQTARDAYGRLVSYLTLNWRDFEAVEDALADAFVAALESWPKAGIPDKPESWSLKVARRKLIDRARRERVSERAMPALIALSEESEQMSSTDAAFPDERVNMLFLCTHPAIDPSIRTPLMLQTVLGMDASRIASAFVVKPSTMGRDLPGLRQKSAPNALRSQCPMPRNCPVV